MGLTELQAWKLAGSICFLMFLMFCAGYYVGKRVQHMAESDHEGVYGPYPPDP